MPTNTLRGVRTASLGCLAAAGCVLVVLSGGGTDTVVVGVEGLVAVVLAVAAAATPEVRARRTLALAAGWLGSSAVGDLCWLVSAGRTSIGSSAGNQEPLAAILCYLVHYVLLAAALLLAAPRPSGAPGWWSTVEDVAGPVQVAASTAALIALASPLGLLLDDGGTSSLFLALDVLVAAAAAGVLVRSTSRVPHPQREERRRVVSTATSVLLFAGADVGIELGLLRGSRDAVALGWSAGLLGVAVLLLGLVRPGSRGGALAGCLPSPPDRGRRSRLVLRLSTRYALPAAVLVTLGTALDALGTGRPVTVGLTVVALVSVAVETVVRLLRTDRDEAAAGAARRDELTGAWTRRGLLEQVAAGDRAAWTVVVLDLDGFKAVNDTFGHAVGDHVLRVTVDRAAAVVGARGLLARLGGDEFVLLLREGRVGPPTAETLRAVRRAVGAPVEFPGGVCSVGASLGWAEFAPGAPAGVAAALDAAVAEADGRMYAEKRVRKTAGRRSGTVPPVAAP